MAIIYSYPTSTPASGDLLIGTDITGNSTQNFTVGSVVTAGISTHITGTVNKVPLFTSANVIGDSIVTQSSNGNIGIGTATPGSKLEVNGEIDAGGDGYLINGMGWALKNSGVLTLGDWDGQEFSTRIMDNNSSEVLRVTDGKVGIGTISPSSKLEVDGGDIEVDDSASGLILKSPDGTRYRITVANGGTLSVTAV